MHLQNLISTFVIATLTVFIYSNYKSPSLLLSSAAEQYDFSYPFIHLQRRMEGLAFYIPFNSISVISGRWKGEHERLCAMKCRLGSGRIVPPAGFETATPVIRS